MDVNPFDAAKRSASGDCVVYSIHLPWIKQKDLKEKSEIMTKLHAAKIQFEIALAPHLTGYLWNKSAFCLFVNDSHDSPSTSRRAGSRVTDRFHALSYHFRERLVNGIHHVVADYL